MPTISMFYGILVLMFFRDNRRHHLPHIHGGVAWGQVLQCNTLSRELEGPRGRCLLSCY